MSNYKLVSELLCEYFGSYDDHPKLRQEIIKLLDHKDEQARIMLRDSAGWWADKNMTVICADNKGHVKLAPKSGYVLRSDGIVYKND